MKKIMSQAMRGGYAVPAFNFYNLESVSAIRAAADDLKAPVILAASESAIKYMGDDFLRFVAAGSIPVHLDHGKSFEAAKNAISLGFQSVMIDGSYLSFDENVRLTKRVVQYAHKYGVWVEAELGELKGVEEGPTPLTPLRRGGGKNPRARGEFGAQSFTNSAQAKKFVEATGCDSLAIAIGTSHGAYKGDGRLRFDILRDIAEMLPRVPLVLHGASQIPAKYARVLGLKGTEGISAASIRHAVRLGIRKVNVDSDARLAWTAVMKQQFDKGGGDFDPRHFLGEASRELVNLYKKEIKLIVGT